jgi:protein-L-isoaspartate(D-aspartate) O-methyltransferase
MAWRSSGSTNDELVNNLKRFGVISSVSVEEGFRNVDRGFFVPKNHRAMAYADQPLKEGNVHLSAPHIYGSVLEALELPLNTSMSFLNAGSGSGYLTCLAATILGPRSSHYCIEIHEDVVEHSKEAIANWKAYHPAAKEISHIEIIRGNALQINAEKGESTLGFDRIYIGAAIGRESLANFKRLLKPGGILVGPVEDDLVKIRRSQNDRLSTITTDHDFSHQVLSGVRFAPLVSYPAIETIIPACVWSPTIHKYYPESFRTSCKELLLCSNAKYDQPLRQEPKKPVNVASMLPRALWMEILSYTHRDWFKAPENEIEYLKRRLKEEQANAEKANLARLEAETRCHLAERERDVYQLLARRWKARLNSQLGQELNNESDNNMEEAAAAMLLGGGARDNANVSIVGLFRRFHARMEQDDDDDDDDAMEEDEEEESYNSEEMADGNEDESTAFVVTSQAQRVASSSKLLRPQVRTVSIAGEDDI